MIETRKGYYKAKKNNSELIIYTGLKKVYSFSVFPDKSNYLPAINTILPAKDGIEITVGLGNSGEWNATGEADE